MNNTLDRAFAFYSRHIYDENKINMLRAHNLKIAGHVPSVLWELFGSILTGRSGNGTTGADLQGWEVKSSTMKNSYEYQYHLNTGEAKLLEDCTVNHLFCSYSTDYRDLVVKAISGSVLKKAFFDAWLPEYRENYDRTASSAYRRQRFRKSIPYSFVQGHGHTILEVNAGEIYRRDDNILEYFNGLVK